MPWKIRVPVAEDQYADLWMLIVEHEPNLATEPNLSRI
jgi:hypothetical protein